MIYLHTTYIYTYTYNMHIQHILQINMVRDGWLSTVMPQKNCPEGCFGMGPWGKLKPPFLAVFCQARKKPPVGGVPSQSVP